MPGPPKCSFRAPLIIAAVRGDIKLVKLLLERGVDLEARDQKKRTALIAAASGGRTGIVKLLVEKGADLQARDMDNDTALIKAARNESNGVVRFLLEQHVGPQEREEAMRIAGQWPPEWHGTAGADKKTKRSPGQA